MITESVAVFFACLYSSKKGLHRTQLQKLLYFASKMGIIEDTFGRGYYGPFSAEVANSAESLVNRNFLNETVEIYPRAVGYRYFLTKDGKEVIPDLKKRFSGEAQRISEISTICKDISIRFLSIAAKVHYILETKGVPMTSEEIVNQARQLDWELSSDEVEAVSKLLRELKLIK